MKSLRPWLASDGMKKAVDIIEYIISGIFILGGVQTGISDAVAGQTVLAAVLGSQLSFIIFGVLFVTLGSLLVYAKVNEKNKLHGWALMGVYCMSTFAFILEMLIFGWGFSAYVDSLTLTILSGFIYLRHKCLNR